MKKRFKNYVGNKLLDLAEWVYAQIPEGKRYSDEDREVMARIEALRKRYRD